MTFQKSNCIVNTLILMVFLNISSHAQKLMLKDSSFFTFSGNIETYLSYDFNTNNESERPEMFFNHKKNREFDINLAEIKSNYNSKSVRATMGLMFGNYVQFNLKSEPDVLKNLYECNVGFKITKNKNIWLDAGILPSHLGSETIISKENKSLTRSMNAENTPYYQTGVKLGYTSNDEKLELAAYLLNGWQRITRNGPMGYGTHLRYKFSDAIDLNYNTYFGYMNASEFRHFHNVYTNIQINEKISTTIDMDFGFQKAIQSKEKPRIWWAPSIIVQYKHSEKLDFALRAEYYGDPKSVMIELNNFYGLRTFSSSFNIDYHITKNVLFRNEIKYLESDQPIYRKKQNDFVKSDFVGVTSLSFYF